MATITTLSFLIHSRYDADGLRRARRDIMDFAGDLDKSSNSLNSWSGRLVLAAKAAAAFTPAIVPIGAAMTKVGASATAMAAAVGAGLTAYGTAMAGAIKKTLEMAEAGKKLAPSQKEFISSVNGMKDAWQKFITATQDKTLATATNVVQGLTAGIKLLKPIVDALHPSILKVSQDFEKWMKGDSAKRYADLIRSAAVPALNNLIAAGKSVINVLGDGFRAFLPEGVRLTQVIKEGAAALNRWSDGGGFQRFLEYVKGNRGPVGEFFRALGDALKTIGGIFKEFSAGSLHLLTDALRVIAALSPENVRALANVFLLLKAPLSWLVINCPPLRDAFIGLLKALNPQIIYAVAAAFVALRVAFMVMNTALLTTPLGWIIMGLTALGVAITIIATKTTWFQTAWKYTWNFIKTVAEAVWNGLKTAWNATVSALQTAWSAVSGALQTAWNATWNGIKTAVETVWNALKTGWNAVVGAFQTAWSTVSTALSTAWSAVWNGIKTAAEAVWNALKTAWDAFINGLQTVWTTVSTALKTAWDTVWNGIKIAAEAVWNALKTAWDAFINGLQTIWTTVSTALKTAWDTVWNGIKIAAETVWNALKTAWDAFINGLQTIWTTVSTALKTAWDAVWNGIKTAAETVWNALKTAWEAFINGLQTVWTTVSTALKTAWDTVWNALKTAAETVWNALKTAWDTFVNALKTAWDTASSALKTAWDTVWNGIKTAAETVWNALKTAWDAFLNALKTAWDTISSALKTAWDTVWNGIKTAAETIWNALKTAWDTFLNALKTAWDTISSALKTAWETAWNAIKTAAETVWNALKTAWDTFLNAMKSLWDTASSAIKSKWEEVWNAIKKFATDLWTSIKSWVSEWWDQLKKLFTDALDAVKKKWEDVWNQVKDFAKKLWNDIGGIIEKAVNGVIGVINKLIGGFNKVASFLKINVKVDEIPQAKFPGLAEGGIVTYAYGGVTDLPKAFAHADGGMANLRNGGTLSGYAPGRDTVPAVLSRGEGVLTPEAVRGLGGPGFVHAANRKFAGHRGAGKMATAPLSAYSFAEGGMAGDIIGMIKPHVGKILSNVYKGLNALDGIGGDILRFFLGSADRTIDADKPSKSEQERRRELMEKAEKGDKDAIKELAKGATGIDRESIAQQPAPFTGRPAPLVGGATNSAQNRPDFDQSKSFGIAEMLGQIVLSLLERDNIAQGFSVATDMVKSWVQNENKAGSFGDLASGFPLKLIKDVIPEYLLKKKAEAPKLDLAGMFGLPVASSKSVQAWAPLAAQALARAGLSPMQLPKFLALMQAESGGNPNAINRTDINAKNGVPSQGLMQVIPPTFAAYRDPSLPNNILDPLANMTAAARYIKARYGGNVPGSPYANGTNSATPGLHLVGEKGPELVGLGGPMMANFGGGETVLPADQTARLFGGNKENGELVLPKDETQKLLNQGGFEGIIKAAKRMQEEVGKSWKLTNSSSASEWATMRDLTMAEAIEKHGVGLPTATTTMQDTSNAAWLDMNTQSAAQWGLMRDTTFTESELHQGTTMPQMATAMQDTSNAAWLDMNTQSAAQWTAMRDTTFAESELHQGTTMPQMATAMQTQSNASWLDMNTQSNTQWTQMRDNSFLPAEDHMGVQMPTTSNTMNTEVSASFTSLGETVTSVMDSGIAKMDEFIKKSEEAVTKAQELIKVVQEAQAAMAAAASGAGGAGGAGGGGGTPVNYNPSAGVEQWRELAMQAMQAGGLDTSQIDAFLALMQAESSGDPNAINNWDSNAAAGTPSKGLMQVIQPTFDAYNVTGGDIMDPYSNMAAAAAYIKARYGGIVPGSPYATGTNSATPGFHLVGENGPELVGMNGPEMALFGGGESVLTNGQTMGLLAALNQTILSIDQFISAVDAAIVKAKAMIAAAQAARAAVGSMGGAAGGAAGAITDGNLAAALARAGNPPIIQGPYSNGALSAGTHAGGGVVDVPVEYFQAMLSAGFIGWIRSGAAWAGNEHAHMLLPGTPDFSPQAAWQVQDYYAGGTGLNIPANLYTGTSNARRGWSWVGERGPELMWMEGGERVKSHTRSMRMLNGMKDDHRSCGGGVTVNFNGPTTEGAVRRAEEQLVPRLRSVMAQGTGRNRP